MGPQHESSLVGVLLPPRCRWLYGVVLVVLVACCPARAMAQNEAPGLPGILKALFKPAANGTAPEVPVELLLTPADAPLQVTRKIVLLHVTNAYDPSGIRYLAIKLKFQNSGTADITVNTKASRLAVGNEEFLRVQVREELGRIPLLIEGELIDGRTQLDVEEAQGPSPLTVPALGKSAEAWLVFAKLPRTRDLSSMTLKLDTSAGPINIDLTQRENAGLTMVLERMGPSGRIGIARVTGELNVLNVPHFAKSLSQFAEQGVSRLVIAMEDHSRIGDELTKEWLTQGREADNDRLQFYPQWPGLIRHIVLVGIPGQEDETGEDSIARSEAEAIQKVTREFLSGLDTATLRREFRSGHPLFQRAILLNAGDTLANEDCEAVLPLIQSPESDQRHAAIQSLRAAVAPQVIPILEGLVRTGPLEEAALALQALNSSQQPRARELAVQLATDPAVQKNIGLARILRAIRGNDDDRWLPFLQSAFLSGDPLERQTALQDLLRISVSDRYSILEAALADKSVPIRDLAFGAMLSRRSPVEEPLFHREALRRLQAGQHDDGTLTALRQIRDPAVLPQLLKWIDTEPWVDSDPQKINLVRAYVEIGGNAALDEMVERMTRFPNETKTLLLSNLFQARHPACHRLAGAGLLSDDREFFELSRTILIEFGDDEAVALFVEAIQKPNKLRIDDVLARSLGYLNCPAALSALKSMQNSSDERLQKLGLIGVTFRQEVTVRSWVQLANEKSENNEFAEAIELLKVAQEIDPQSGRVFNSLGFAQLHLSQNVEAKANFEKAMARLPDDHNPITGFAICLAIEGRTKEATQMVDTPALLWKYRDQQIYQYNVACVYGRSIEAILKTPYSSERDETVVKYQKQAILYLNTSINKGFQDLRLLETDADLHSLRELPEFKKLEERLREYR